MYVFSNIISHYFSFNNLIQYICICCQVLNKNIVFTRPGTDVYIEEQGECLSLVIKSSSKTLAGTYKCVTTVDGVQHSQVHHLDVYGK